MSSHPLQVLVVGTLAADTWRSTATLLPQYSAVEVSALTAASDWLGRTSDQPLLIIVGQAWPGEIAQDELESIARLAPLSRLVLLLNSWCEGQLRHSAAWPASIRLYVHQWAQRAVRELTAIAQGESSPWNLPATTTGEERILGQKSDSFERGGTIVIIAREHSTASVLDDACRSVGYQTVVLRDPKAATISDAMAVVWDTSAADATDPSRVTDLQRRFADAKILAIWGFPRADEIARAQTAGVTAVVSKPFLLADLIWQIDQLAGDFVGDQTGSSQVSSRSARKISRRHSGSWIGQPHTRMPGTSANIGKP